MECGGRSSPIQSADEIDYTSQTSVEWLEFLGGKFKIGGHHEMRERWLEVGPFLLARAETTVLQYATCVAAGGCTAPGPTSCDRSWDKPSNFPLPVNYVSWAQASDFCHWVGGRLPSEVEWEFAIQGSGQGGSEKFGKDAKSCDATGAIGENCDGCKNDQRWPVCTADNYVPTGPCDIGDNFDEWVADEGMAPGLEDIDSAAGYRVVRYGPGDRYDAHFGGVLDGRWSKPPQTQEVNLGFRCAKSTQTIDGPGS